MKYFNDLESKTWDQLSKAYELLRNMHIALDGQIDAYKSYPDLDEIAHEQFRRLSNGTDHITLSAAWIMENATEVA
jgi:hypothetical protein